MPRFPHFLTPARCHVLFVALVLFDVGSRVMYLRGGEGGGALPLAPDEAQYWVWSRQLDVSYYSKPGMVAWLIRASTELLGNTMVGVRMPAVVLGAGTLVLTYVLAMRVFSSARVALGAALLTHAVPMYIAGSMLMTIDAPFCFFWALATVCFVMAVGSEKKAAVWFVLAGVAVGLGFLTKYSALLFLVGALTALLLPEHRWRLRTVWPWVMGGVSFLFTVPIWVWNSRYGWVSAKHVKADVANGFSVMEPLAFIGGTVAAVGVFLAPLVGMAVWRVLRGVGVAQVEGGGVPPHMGETPMPQTVHGRPEGEIQRHAGAGRPRDLERALVMTALPYLGIVTVTCLFTTAKINWSAPGWFALLVVTAGFIGATWDRRGTRVLLVGTILLGGMVAVVSHNTAGLYPLIAKVQTGWLGWGKPLVRKWDPTARLRGWPELGRVVGERIPEGGFVLADTYSDAAELEFYVPGQPATYVLGSYLDVPQYRGRMSQWDLWAERSLEPSNTALLGRDAVFVGPNRSELKKCFESVEELAPVVTSATVRGERFEIDTYRVWVCRKFRGLPRPVDGGNSY